MLGAAANATGGQPGDSSRAPLPATATEAAVTAPSTPEGPKRPVIATHATATAASASTHRDPDAGGTRTSTPATTATPTNHPRTGSRRSPARRSQPRTVDAGTPSRPAIVRCPDPPAFASSAAQIHSARYALRSSNDTGSNTWVTAQPRQRARRGRTGSASPTILRARP